MSGRRQNMNVLNLIKGLLVLHGLNVLIVIVFVAVLFFLWKKGKRKHVLFVINWLVAEAEKELGSKTGKYKKGKVIEALYNRLPIVVTLLFTRKEIEVFIDQAAIDLKEFLKQKENDLDGHWEILEPLEFHNTIVNE